MISWDALLLSFNCNCKLIVLLTYFECKKLFEKYLNETYLKGTF